MRFIKEFKQDMPYYIIMSLSWIFAIYFLFHVLPENSTQTSKEFYKSSYTNATRIYEQRKAKDHKKKLAREAFRRIWSNKAANPAELKSSYEAIEKQHLWRDEFIELAKTQADRDDLGQFREAIQKRIEYYQASTQDSSDDFSDDGFGGEAGW